MIGGMMVTPTQRPTGPPGPIKIFLAGDVMTGRGIDQILKHPGNPVLHEASVKDARAYRELAERTNGPVPRRIGPEYIWGEALQEFKRDAPDAGIINLETSVTTSEDYWQGKEVHYRMNPRNIDSLTAAPVDACCLANNHVLDWGYEGLRETLDTLKKAGIRSAGAGMDLQEAAAPAIVAVEGKGRLIVFAYASVTSGVPREWEATENRPGVNLLADFSENTAREIRNRIRSIKRKNDIVVFSIHWGGNWGYAVPDEETRFAHDLIDSGVDIVHGHSSHHVKGIELYRGRPILYGCGDFLNDYEGIPGYEHYRGDLVLMFLACMDPATGGLVQLRMIPFQIKKFRLDRVTGTDALLMTDTLNRESKRFGSETALHEHTILTLAGENCNLCLTMNSAESRETD